MKKIDMIQAGLFALLIGGAPLAFAGGDDPVSSDECRAQWNKSSAEGTCVASDVDAVGHGDCTVIAKCKMADQTWNYNTYATGDYDDFHTLTNCDGHLRWSC